MENCMEFIGRRGIERHKINITVLAKFRFLDLKLRFSIPLGFPEIFSDWTDKLRSRLKFTCYVRRQKVYKRIIAWEMVGCSSFFSPPMRLHSSLVKHRAGAFGCTVPCNGLFSGCLAIRFYRLEEKACVNTSRRGCVSHRWVHVLHIIQLRVRTFSCVFTPTAQTCRVKTLLRAGATRDTLLQRDKYT